MLYVVVILHFIFKTKLQPTAKQQLADPLCTVYNEIIYPNLRVFRQYRHCFVDRRDNIGFLKFSS
jgi:hypothetical protein